MVGRKGGALTAAHETAAACNWLAVFVSNVGETIATFHDLYECRSIRLALSEAVGGHVSCIDPGVGSNQVGHQSLT